MEHENCDSMEVCHNPGKSVLISLSSSSSRKAPNGNSFWARLGHSRPNSAESFHRDFTMPCIGGYDMVAALRGLILYKGCRKACIYNPTIRQSLILPAVKSNIFAREGFGKYVNYFLGYDHVLDQYKVLCTVVIYSEDLMMITSEQWVFVLEVGGSWKSVGFNQPHLPNILELERCINGVIYYLASNYTFLNIVVSFDVRSEEFDMIQAPPEVTEFGTTVGFIEYGGKPAILGYPHLPQKGMVELCVLEDGGKWSKTSLLLQPCHMHLVNIGVDLVVKGTTQNGEVILIPVVLISPYYILYYDLQKNHLRKVKVGGLEERFDIKPYFSLKHMDESERASCTWKFECHYLFIPFFLPN